MSNFEFKFLTSIAQVDAAAWNRLYGDDYPFILHEFLTALESSGSVDETSGWEPNHLAVYRHEELVGALPLYKKTNSYGEYVFDFEWVNAYHQNGIHYYPKLLSAIPFTPCSGPRIGIEPSYEQELLLPMIEHIKQYCGQNGFSSWHLLFPDPALARQLNQLSMTHLSSTHTNANEWVDNNKPQLLKRTGLQYHWYNKNYQDFNDFLGQCRQKKRKNIRRERKAIRDANINLEFVEGQEASEQLWMQFFKFYQRTYLKRSGNTGYLNWAFFEYIASAMPEKLVLIVAKFERQVIGMSLFFKGCDTLYGRYWGASVEFVFLHFEACYYQGIEYCINQNLQHFDAGAQGEHKIPRGFKPIETCSFHWIEHPQFRDAIASYLGEERKYVSRAMSDLAHRLPFKFE